MKNRNSEKYQTLENTGKHFLLMQAYQRVVDAELEQLDERMHDPANAENYRQMATDMAGYQQWRVTVETQRQAHGSALGNLQDDFPLSLYSPQVKQELSVLEYPIVERIAAELMRYSSALDAAKTIAAVSAVPVNLSSVPWHIRRNLGVARQSDGLPRGNPQPLTVNDERRVRFVYQDDPREPVRHSAICYWAYSLKVSDREQAELFRYGEHAAPEDKSNHPHFGYGFPLSVGATDDNGYFVLGERLQDNQDAKRLTSRLHKADIRLHGSAIEAERGIRPAVRRAISPTGTYRMEASTLESLQRASTWSDQLEEQRTAAWQKARQQQRNTLPANYFYGFVPSPLGMGKVALEPESLDDIRGSAPSAGATPPWVTWYGALPPVKPITPSPLGYAVTVPGEMLDISDAAEISLFCSLPQWLQRIQLATARVKRVLATLQSAALPYHMASYVTTVVMDDISLQERFSAAGLSQGERNQFGKLMSDLSGVQDWFAGRHRLALETDPEQGSLEKPLADLTPEADNLAKLLRSPHLLAEFNRYLASCQQQAAEKTAATDKHHSAFDQLGPDLPKDDAHATSVWPAFFSVLADAYSVLAEVPGVSEAIWRESVEPIVEGLAGNGLRDLVASAQSFSDGVNSEELGGATRFAVKLDDMVSKTPIPTDTLLGQSIQAWITEQKAQNQALPWWQSSALSQAVNFAGASVLFVPGPPSLLGVLLEQYQKPLVNWLQKGQAASKSGARLTVSLLYLFGLNSELAPGDSRLRNGHVLSDFWTSNSRFQVGRLSFAQFFREGLGDYKEHVQPHVGGMAKLVLWIFNASLIFDSLGKQKSPAEQDATVSDVMNGVVAGLHVGAAGVMLAALVNRWAPPTAAGGLTPIDAFTQQWSGVKIVDLADKVATLVTIFSGAAALVTAYQARADSDDNLADQKMIEGSLALAAGSLHALNSVHKGAVATHWRIPSFMSVGAMEFALSKVGGGLVAQALSSFANSAAVTAGRSMAVALTGRIATMALSLSNPLMWIYTLYELGKLLDQLGALHTAEQNKARMHWKYLEAAVPVAWLKAFKQESPAMARHWNEAEAVLTARLNKPALEKLSWHAAIPMKLQGYDAEEIRSRIIWPEAQVVANVIGLSVMGKVFGRFRSAIDEAAKRLMHRINNGDSSLRATRDLQAAFSQFEKAIEPDIKQRRIIDPQLTSIYSNRAALHCSDVVRQLAAGQFVAPPPEHFIVSDIAARWDSAALRTAADPHAGFAVAWLEQCGRESLDELESVSLEKAEEAFSQFVSRKFYELEQEVYRLINYKLPY